MIANQQYTKGFSISPSDTVDFTTQGGGPSKLTADAIYVGGAGVLAVVLQDGTVVNFTVGAGQLLPVRARRINATNTTATLLVGLIAL